LGPNIKQSFSFGALDWESTPWLSFMGTTFFGYEENSIFLLDLPFWRSLHPHRKDLVFDFGGSGVAKKPGGFAGRKRPGLLPG